MDSLNVMFVRLDGCVELSDTLNSQILNYQFALSTEKHLAKLQDEKILLQQRILVEQDKQIRAFEKNISKQEKKIKWLKLQRNVAVGIVGLLAIKMFFIR